MFSKRLIRWFFPHHLRRRLGERQLKPIHYRPYLELYEARLLLSAHPVMNTADTGPGSLRQAILDSNADPGVSQITFNIGSGVQTIRPASALPTITHAVTIDGTTQPGFAGTPLIVLDGGRAGANANGLLITAGSSTVKDLAIDHFTAAGIVLTTGGGDVLTGNYIGIDSTGAAAGNGGFGISVITGSSNNTIGGTTAAARNVIAANTSLGVGVIGGSGNLIQGNRIGTNAAGTAALGNGGGVAFINSANNTAGGTAAGAGNLISGNQTSGIGINGATGNIVQGNFIGTDVNGTRALGNEADGVFLLSGASRNLIGGTAAGARNIISGNAGRGIEIDNPQTTSNLVQGNYFGTDVSGSRAVGNGQLGALIADSPNNTIGGTTAAARNLIAGNGPSSGRGGGLEIELNGAAGNVVEGNYIGTDVSGTAALGNTGTGEQSGFGVEIVDASDNQIGGAAAGAGNVIAASSGDGVSITIRSGIMGQNPVATGNRVQGNFIGTDASGTAALGNGGNGVTVAPFTGSSGNESGNTIGGTATGAGNVIAANTGNGVTLSDSGTSGNLVQGNYIGTDANGDSLGNGADGLDLVGGASSNTVGGIDPGAGNVIGTNTGNGVTLSDASTTANLVQGNFIGTDANGDSLGNGGNGVAVVSASNNTIAANTIANNGNDGLLIDTGTGNLISQNSIFSSGNLGIELVNNGNNNQVAPMLTSATSDGSSTTAIQGTLSAAPDTTFTLEFFANAVCNPSGFGEGQQFLDFVPVTTDDSGNVTFTAMLSVGVAPGQFVSATATDPGNNTSTFAACVAVTAPDGAPASGALRAVRAAAIAGRTETAPVAVPGENRFAAVSLATPQLVLTPGDLDDWFSGAATSSNGFSTLGPEPWRQLPPVAVEPGDLGSMLLVFLDGKSR